MQDLFNFKEDCGEAQIYFVGVDLLFASLGRASSRESITGW